MAKVAAAEGDLHGAIDHLDRAEQLYQPGFMPQLRPIPAMRARMSIVQGELAEAEAWATAVGRDSESDEVDHRREFELLTLARLLIAQHREQRDGESADSAVALLGRLRAAAEMSGRRRSVVETHVLSALALDAQGQRLAGSRVAGACVGRGCGARRARSTVARRGSADARAAPPGRPAHGLAQHEPNDCSTSPPRPRRRRRGCLNSSSDRPCRARWSTR